MTTEIKTVGLLTADEAARWMGISVRKFRSLDLRRVQIGRCVRYDVRDLQLYADLNGNRTPFNRRLGA